MSIGVKRVELGAGKSNWVRGDTSGCAVKRKGRRNPMNGHALIVLPSDIRAFLEEWYIFEKECKRSDFQFRRKGLFLA